MKTVIKQNQTLEKLIYNLPVMIFSLILLIRLLVAIPLTIVSINKFEFLHNGFMQYTLGIGSILTLEILLTVLSLLTAEFRRKISNNWANSVLVLVVLLTVYTSYLIQSLSKMYVVEFSFNVFLTLHILNIVSVLLSESIGFLLKKADELLKVATQTENTTVATNKVANTTTELPKVAEATNKQLPDDVLQRIKVASTNKEKVLLVKDFLTQKEIIELLGIDKSQVSRYCKI